MLCSVLFMVIEFYIIVCQGQNVSCHSNYKRASVFGGLSEYEPSGMKDQLLKQTFSYVYMKWIAQTWGMLKEDHCALIFRILMLRCLELVLSIEEALVLMLLDYSIM